MNHGGTKYSEMTVVADIIQWFNEIAKQEKVPVSARTEVIIKGVRIKRADILIYVDGEYGGVIEFKPPYWSAYNQDLIDDASLKALKIGAPYFGTWNTNQLVLWTLREVDIPLLDRRQSVYSVVSVRSLDDLRRREVVEGIKGFLKVFIHEFYDLYTERAELKKPPIDEFFINYLRSTLDSHFIPLSDEIALKFRSDSRFSKKLRSWFVEQMWTTPTGPEDFDKAARQFIYLLVDKLLFYNILRMKRREERLERIHVQKERTRTDTDFKNALRPYFDRALKIDYETIFGTDFVEQIPIPKDAIPHLVSFVNQFSEHDFSRLTERDIGRIFDRMIPEHERHLLGQYFTRTDVVDLISGFCINSSDDLILDAGCGAGTFLVRAYSRIKTRNPRKTHREILAQLWGVDIAKFPVHLATINLAKADLSEEENYPNIIRSDFFDVSPEKSLRLTHVVRKTKGLDKSDHVVSLPREFDAVIGNPPYTRQEEMEDIFEGSKKKIRKVVKGDWGIDVGKRSSIFAYFFLHGIRFLREGGRFGFVTSNSWLDVDYGKHLQEFFLLNMKVVAIIESKTERWFEDADVNTAITILERCSLKRQRDNNSVKFVQLKKPLSHFVQASDSEDERWRSVEDLVRTITRRRKFFENDEMRVFLKKQKDLWEEGFDEEAGRYVGSKWGRYIRAPRIFFEILEKRKDKLVPLRKLVSIRRGFTTGANKFFYLDEEEIRNWGIEKEFWMHREGRKWIPNYVLKSPRECNSRIAQPNDMKYRVIMIHKDKSELKGTNVLKYIRWGEEQGYDRRSTCAARKRWYDLGSRERPPLVWIKGIWDRHFVPRTYEKAYLDQQLYEITPKENDDAIWIALNSTLNALMTEMSGRVTFGEGILWIAAYEAGNALVLNPHKLNKSQLKKLSKAFTDSAIQPVASIFEEIGAQEKEDVSIDAIQPDRRRIDEIILGEILGLTEEEQLEVYRAVVDLVRTRMEKAKSVDRKRKRRGVDTEALADAILREIDISDIGRFPDDYIKERRVRRIEIPSGVAEASSDMYGFFVRIGDEVIRCSSKEEAKFMEYASKNGSTSFEFPVEKTVVKKAVMEYGKKHRGIWKEIRSVLDATVPDKKLRKTVERVLLRRIYEVKTK